MTLIVDPLSYCIRRVFFFNDTPTTEIYTLSLHDALPIWARRRGHDHAALAHRVAVGVLQLRSEEHTSELQSRQYLVCRLLLEKKNTNHTPLGKFSSTSARTWIASRVFPQPPATINVTTRC